MHAHPLRDVPVFLDGNTRRVELGAPYIEVVLAGAVTGETVDAVARASATLEENAQPFLIVRVSGHGGSEADAARVAGKFKEMRDRGVAVATVAEGRLGLNQLALLATGSPGHRYVHPSAELHATYDECEHAAGVERVTGVPCANALRTPQRAAAHQLVVGKFADHVGSVAMEVCMKPAFFLAPR